MYKVLLMSWALILLFLQIKSLFDRRSVEERNQKFVESVQTVKDLVWTDGALWVAKMMVVLGVLVAVLFYSLFFVFSASLMKSNIMFFVASGILAYYLIVLYGVVAYLDFDYPERLINYYESIELIGKFVYLLTVFYLIYFLYVCLKS